MRKAIRREQGNENAEKTGYVAYYRVSTGGGKLGNPRWAESIGKAREARIRQIPRVPPPVIEMVQRLRLEGGTLRAVAAKLNALGLRTPRGGRWHASGVRATLCIRIA